MMDVGAGAALAVLAGLGYNAAAAVEKREAIEVTPQISQILFALARRRLWLAANLLAIVAWTAQVAALALAPIALVMPLMGAGAALLVALGVRWLGERFGKLELLAIASAGVGAAVAASAVAGSPVAPAPLFGADLAGRGVVSTAPAARIAGGASRAPFRAAPRGPFPAA